LPADRIGIPCSLEYTVKVEKVSSC